MDSAHVYYHGHCFDGVLSAAVIARFFRQRYGERCRIAFRGMTHRNRDPYGANHAAFFDGSINAVVDFRYSPASSLNWWCDHHHTAFLSEEDRLAFERGDNPQHCFDPAAPSCAALLDRFLRDNHGFDGADAVDLSWADRIDGAQFSSPKEPVELESPALRLMQLLESAPSWELEQRIITLLMERNIEAVEAAADVRQAVSNAVAQHTYTISQVAERMKVEHGVAIVDLRDMAQVGINRYIPYYLSDELHYAVVLSAPTGRSKVGLSRNPWAERGQPLDLATLAAEFGGGGHAAAAAVVFASEDRAAVDRCAAKIAERLRMVDG
ncbi:MAG: hypothetical protein H6707_05505 [Deltaproteobacteria bacterium]|nr:hypothetical protein [Deltaproteobacteria bacterium]